MSDPSHAGMNVQPMRAWRFLTESFPRAERQRAWLQAIDRLCLPVAAPPDPDRLSGEILCLKSSLGTEIAVVRSGPHEFSGEYRHQPAAIWLTMLLEGRARLLYGGESIELSPSDIVYGPTGVGAGLSFETTFRQLFIKVPRLLFDSQLVAPTGLQVSRVEPHAGIEHVFLAMLHSLAQSLCRISSDELRPIEISLTEFLITALGLQRAGAGARSTHLQRICQTIETMLGNPDLSLEMVADAEGVSPRYLQKLFTEAGETFRDYRRKRRLERCRADLISPLYAHLSITEICFRWGFNGSAHFSRAFRTAFGISPREYRRSAKERAQSPAMQPAAIQAERAR